LNLFYTGNIIPLIIVILNSSSRLFLSIGEQEQR